MEVATPTVSAVHISPLGSGRDFPPEGGPCLFAAAFHPTPLVPFTLQLTCWVPLIQPRPHPHHHPLLVSSEVRRPCQEVCFSLQLVGKSPGQVLMAASTSSLHHSRLFFVTDHSSGLRFLVDTGAEVSVLPVSRVSHSTSPAGPTLQAVNHSTIATFGSTSQTINLGLR